MSNYFAISVRSGYLTDQLALQLVIFFSTCDAVDFHFALMNDFQLSSAPGSKKEPFLESKVFRLHGNMPQKERTDTFLQFGKASAAFLICTDVASRGLDFKGVTCIVQYDPPGDPAEYVHRWVGALSFFWRWFEFTRKSF